MNSLAAKSMRHLSFIVTVVALGALAPTFAYAAPVKNTLEVAACAVLLVMGGGNWSVDKKFLKI